LADYALPLSYFRITFELWSDPHPPLADYALPLSYFRNGWQM